MGAKAPDRPPPRKPGEPIPPADIKGAAKGSGKNAQRAQLALTLAKLRAKKKMGK